MAQPRLGGPGLRRLGAVVRAGAGRDQAGRRLRLFPGGGSAGRHPGRAARVSLARGCPRPRGEPVTYAEKLTLNICFNLC